MKNGTPKAIPKAISRKVLPTKEQIVQNVACIAVLARESSLSAAVCFGPTLFDTDE